MKKELAKKLLAITLALAVGVTFVPLLGNSVYAEDEATDPADVVLGTGAGEKADAVAVDNDTDTDSESPEFIESEEQTITTDKEADVIIEEDGDIAAKDNGTSLDSERKNLLNKAANDLAPAQQEEKATIETMADNTAEQFLQSFTAKMNHPKRILNINAKFTKDVFFAAVIIDGNTDNVVKSYNTPGAAITDSLSMANYSSLANHTVTLVYWFTNNSEDYSFADRAFKLSMYAKPSAKGSIEIYHNHIIYMPSPDPNLVNYRLRLQVLRNGKVVKTSGLMSAVQTYKIKGLKPNTNYKIRTFYYYNGYQGTDTGKVLNLGTYRTGLGKKPAVKSIKVKAYNVKKKKQKIYGYYTGLYLGKRTYYKYKLKIIVTLKKKPGNKIWINGKKYKGNKKKYTVKLGTFTSYSKPKGKKYTVAMYTYRNGSWGGYSPMYKTVKRIK